MCPTWGCLLAVLLIALTAVAGQDPHLEILPSTRPICNEVGTTLALTCKAVVPDTKLITNLEWRDKKGQRIESTSRAHPIYIQKYGEDLGLMLIFSKLTEQHKGTYSCHANYANTEPLQSSVEVETFVDAEFVEAPEKQYPVAGTQALIKCRVRGKPMPIVEWYKGDDSLANNTAKYFSSNDGLYIINVTERDDGHYKCLAVVPVTGRFKTRNIEVEVLVPPRVNPIEEVSVVEGGTGSVKCTSSGKPPAVYTWLKADQRNDLSKTDRFDVKPNTGELIMNKIEFGDNGLYKCRAENRAGSDETTVRINVLVKPEIYELLNATASVTNQTKLTCKVKGRPPPKVTFRKRSNLQPYIDGLQPSDNRITLEEKSSDGETVGVLTISNLSRSDDGLYECIGQNPTGTAYKNSHITVWFKPTFDRTRNLPAVWSWDGKPGNLTCIPEAIPNATITWRVNQVEINERNFDGLLQRDIYRVEGTSPQSSLIVATTRDSRSLFTHYECIARNGLGEASIMIELKKGEVPNVITEVRPQSITSTTVKFSIIPPITFGTLPIKSYSVQYRPEGRPWDGAPMHTWSAGAPYILERLVPETTYDFRFAARNDVGMGGWLNAQQITMPQISRPDEPRLILPDYNSNQSSEQVVASPYSNHFELRWSVPAENGEPLDYYDIKRCEVEMVGERFQDKHCAENVPQSIQYTTYQLEYLQPDTIYRVELRAHNAIGYSSPAQLYVRTARGIGLVVPAGTPAMSSAMIIGIVVAAIILILIVLDLTCFLVNRTGLIALCCDKTRRKKTDEEESKLGREEKEPLKPQPEEKPSSVEYDGRQVYTKSGEIIGKHSAV